jgi:hypothetical protein
MWFSRREPAAAAVRAHAVGPGPHGLPDWRMRADGRRAASVRPRLCTRSFPRGLHAQIACPSTPSLIFRSALHTDLVTWKWSKLDPCLPHERIRVHSPQVQSELREQRTNTLMRLRASRELSRISRTPCVTFNHTAVLFLYVIASALPLGLAPMDPSLPGQYQPFLGMYYQDHRG